MTSEEKQLGIEAAAAARSELYDTLAQLKVQLNYAQRVDDAVERTKQRIILTKRRKPLVFAAAVAGAAVAVGAVVWGIAVAVSKQAD